MRGQDRYREEDGGGGRGGLARDSGAQVALCMFSSFKEGCLIFMMKSEVGVILMKKQIRSCARGNFSPLFIPAELLRVQNVTKSAPMVRRRLSDHK